VSDVPSQTPVCPFVSWVAVHVELCCQCQAGDMMTQVSACQSDGHVTCHVLAIAPMPRPLCCRLIIAEHVHAECVVHASSGQGTWWQRQFRRRPSRGTALRRKDCGGALIVEQRSTKHVFVCMSWQQHCRAADAKSVYSSIVPIDLQFEWQLHDDASKLQHESMRASALL
jgi:hypothetical protein